MEDLSKMTKQQKIIYLTDLAEEMVKKISSDPAEWKKFLAFSAKFYKYSFEDQVLIFAQRPDAVACAEYSLWNDIMRRYIVRGSKGIPLITKNDDGQDLRYVFDVADTREYEKSRPLNLFEMKDEYFEIIISALNNISGKVNIGNTKEVFLGAATVLAEEYWEANEDDIFDNLKHSAFDQYFTSPEEFKEEYIKLLAASSAYSVVSRIDLDGAEVFNKELSAISMLNTDVAAKTFGIAVNDVNKTLLSDIIKKTKEYDKQKETERSEHGRQQNTSLGRDRIYSDRRLPISELRPSDNTEKTDRQIRQDENGISQRASSNQIRDTLDGRGSVSAPLGDPGDSRAESGDDNERAAGAESATGQEQGSAGLGEPYEQPKDEGRGAGDSGTDIQLSFLNLIPSQDEQISIIESINKAEDEKTSAFLFADEDIDNILRFGSNADEHNISARERIIVEFSRKQSIEDRAEILKNLFHGGYGIETVRGEISAWFEEDGVRLRFGEAARFKHNSAIISWEYAAERIGDMLQKGTFATKEEQATAYDRWRNEVAERLCFFERDIEIEYIDKYLTEIYDIEDRGFPKFSDAVSEKLLNLEFRAKVVEDLAALKAAHENGEDVFRFPRLYRLIDNLAKDVLELGIEPIDYPQQSESLPRVIPFITQDEIDQLLITRGSGISGGKKRIYDFFTKSASGADKANFLKDEFGTGGSSSAISRSFHSWENHDSKGLTLEKAGCDPVILKWPQVAKRIEHLIATGRYLAQEEIEKFAQEEKESSVEQENEIQVVSNDISNEEVLETSDAETNLESIEVHLASSEEADKAPENYIITDYNLGEGSPKSKFRANIEAVKTLKLIESENRLATSQEQEILSRYVGWGGLSDAFDATKESWSSEYKELGDLLTTEEYASARASTLNAHFTTPQVIAGMYKALSDMGFEGGRILEPSMGVGNFFGMLPEEMRGSKLYGVELDELSGRIAKQLYPNADITIAGFETTNRRDFFDVAIGNVPFGDYKVRDKAYDKLNFSIHNYFFAKALDQVRPGGIVCFITSRYTMDQKSPDVRRYLAQRAELIGAVRLPNTAFKNAGAEVVSDIIFLKKRDRAVLEEPDWVFKGQTQDGFEINDYFVQHPEMILGDLKEISSRFGKDITVAPNGDNLEEQIVEAARNFTARYEAEKSLGEEIGAEELEEITGNIDADPDVRNFSFTLVGGDVYYRENAIMRPITTDAVRVKGLVELRDKTVELINMQTEDYPDEEIKVVQEELGALYDKFTSVFGSLNSKQNAKAFDTDSSYYLLCSLENTDEEGNVIGKADMFSKRTIRPEKKIVSADTPAEALALSIGERGFVDLMYMQSLLGEEFTVDRITQELSGVIYNDPKAGWQTADEYLSGNIRKKLEIAEKALETEPMFQINVDALKKAMPKELDASEIDIRLGATWLDTEVIERFMYETFDTPYSLQANRYGYNYGRRITVEYSNLTSSWQIQNKTAVSNYDVMAYNTFGTARANAYRILEDTLNLKDVRIYDKIEDENGKEKSVLNKKETMLAQQKQQQIKDAFREWVWKDPQRRETLAKKYNELFNSSRPREYDGQHINFAGMNPEIELLEHQRAAVAHVLYGGNTLLAHEVGAGKTFEMAASCMESKRLGMSNKALFVVPNHLTLQWANEFMRLYPSANLLVANKKDFETANRKKFCSRIATGDYDAVIIGHSQFEKIPISKERQQMLLEDQINDLIAGIDELKYRRGQHFTIKQMEKTKRSLETRLKKLLDDDKKDDVITFEQLGIDRLYVDESHAYKNLFLYTKMRNVAGLSTSEAQKSSDMFMKCRYMDEITGGRGVIFATGTPVSNSMTEMYTLMRYLQYDALSEKNLSNFDAWASTFGETTTAIELAPEGTGYRARTRFAKFFNLPELMNMFKDVADIKTSDQLNLPVPNAEFETVVVKPSDIQKEMVESLSERAAKIHAGGVDASVDNMLKITSDGRKIGLDQRLINDMLPDDPGSKLNVCIKNIFDIWEGGKDQKLTQLVFCDMSTPKNDGTFNVYDDIKNKLIARGIPEDEIAFIHTADTEAKKRDLFAKVRSGQVRVLLGSTQKMGAGTNVQDRLYAVHHLDVGWRPSDMTQRNGRIIRQGNRNKNVKVFQYVTEGTFDAYLYQTLENKQKFISQIMTSKSPVRACDDIDEQALSYAEIKALCAGNPLIKEKMDLDVEVARLKVLKSDHQSKIFRLEDQLLKSFPMAIESAKGNIDGYEKDLELIKKYPQPQGTFSGMRINGGLYKEAMDAGKALLDAINAFKGTESVSIGSFRGFELLLKFDPFEKQFIATLKGAMSYSTPLGKDTRGNITRIENLAETVESRLGASKDKLEELYKQQQAADEEIKKPFAFEEDLKAKSARLAELNIALNMDEKDIEVASEAGTEEQEEDKEPTLDEKIAAAHSVVEEQETNKEYEQELTL